MPSQDTLSPVKALPPVPFDLAALGPGRNGAAQLAWPVSQAMRRTSITRVAETVANELGGAAEGPVRDAAIVGFPDALLNSLRLANAAMLVSKTLAEGREIVGGPPELAELAGETTYDGVHTPGAYLVPPKFRLTGLRRLVRTATWSRPSSLLRSLVRPEVIVLSHNSLLRAHARREGVAAWYYPPEQLLATIKPGSERLDIPGLDEFTGHVASSIAKSVELDRVMTKRLADLLKSQLHPIFLRAAKDLAMARQLSLPDRVWAGPIGSTAIRSVALSVKEKGGEVTLFDHGGGTVTAEPNPVRPVRDYTIASRVVLPTRMAAEMTEKQWRGFPMPHCPRPEFVPGWGEATMREIPRRSERVRADSPRVLYLPTPMLGFREILPPMLPDPVALDWQLRMARTLGRLPVDAKVRPHPEGALPALKHPVIEALPHADGPYHEVIAQTDKFIFEYQHSTAFWEALCTDKPVILVDLGLTDLSVRVAEIVARRCHIVPVEYDANNLPQMDMRAFEEALCSDSGAADPSEVRALLIGDTDR